MMLTDFLLEPKLRGIDLQGYDRIGVHADILAAKPLIRNVFREFYSTCVQLDRKYFGSVTGSRIELGAGTSFFKKEYPEIISTDIQPAPHLDGVIDAESMPLDNQSVRVFYGINCFHHFPHPTKFFSELLRTLKPGGGCVLIDPYFGFLAARIYKRLFTSEAFDLSADNWSYHQEDKTNESRPNQALSYLVFFRDKDRFQQLYPDLEIAYSAVLLNYSRYLLSGGLNFRQLAPTSAEPLLAFLERLLSPIASVFGLHHVIVLRKRER